MDKKKIAEFFDGCACWWDADMIRNEDVIATILDNGGIRPGVSVLDVACGTGVLFPDYLKRETGTITAIDISPEMAKIAASKYPGKIDVLCGDVETAEFGKTFDCIVVYNAFPHFPDPENLIRALSGLLNPGGTLTVAHGMSRAAIDHHHEGAASKVSNGLISEDALAEIFAKHLTVTTKISNDRMYQVCGKRI